MKYTLHAGIHKTATTSLQEHVFPNAKDVFYTGKNRFVMWRQGSELKVYNELQSFLHTNTGSIERLPLHVLCYYLSFLQDTLVRIISRQRISADQLSPYFTLISELSSSIEKKSTHPHILYSCEGLLLSIGHLYPESSLEISSPPPLAHWRNIFQGEIARLIIYLRDPLSYLFSRYIQIHTVRIRSHSDVSSKALSPSSYLDLHQALWQGRTPSQSVFFHINHEHLSRYLRDLGLSPTFRSYEQHICATMSISDEFNEAFGLSVFSPSDVDRCFKDVRLNTTASHKDRAVNALLAASGLPDQESLKREFYSTALSYRCIREAVESSYFPIT